MLEDETESMTTATVEISEQLKHDLDEWDIDVDVVVLEALEAEVRDRRRDELRSRADDFRQTLAECLDVDDVVASIRNSRRTQ